MSWGSLCCSPRLGLGGSRAVALGCGRGCIGGRENTRGGVLDLGEGRGSRPLPGSGPLPRCRTFSGSLLALRGKLKVLSGWRGATISSTHLPLPGKHLLSHHCSQRVRIKKARPRAKCLADFSSLGLHNVPADQVFWCSLYKCGNSSEAAAVAQGHTAG